MTSALERALSRLTLQHPMSKAETRVVRDEATRFATELLDNYKTQLGQRPIQEQSPQRR